MDKEFVSKYESLKESLKGDLFLIMKDILTNDQLLLIEQWVSYYKKIPDNRFEEIKEEIKMSFIATTITEHIQHESEIKGEIKLLESLYKDGVPAKEEFDKRIIPLRKQLERWNKSATTPAFTD